MGTGPTNRRHEQSDVRKASEKILNEAHKILNQAKKMLSVTNDRLHDARKKRSNALEDQKLLLRLMSSPGKGRAASPSVVEDTRNDNGKRQHVASAEDGKRQRRRFSPGNATFVMGTGPTKRRRIVKAVKPMHTS